jgi:predicted DNA-binding transcriptional regulator YafY
MDIEFLKRVDQFIRLRATGTPNEFAQKLSVSERTLYNYLNWVKTYIEAPIEYCKKSKTYYYAENGRIQIGFCKEIRPCNLYYLTKK